MAVFPVHPAMWSSFLVLWFLQSAETDSYSLDCWQNAEECENIWNSVGLQSNEEATDDTEIFICLLYPTNELNCSWSFNTLEKNTQLSVCISVCSEKTAIDSKCTSAKKVGWMAFGEKITEESQVYLHLNMSQHNNRTSYTCAFDMEGLELLSPPPNISASFHDGVLTVTWDVPHTRKPTRLDCFEYELDMYDQEGPKYLVDMQNYTVLNPDPAYTHRVRMRTRISKGYCFGSSQWSDWSPTLTLAADLPVSTLSPLAITFICLGIPMILLAVLLFVRYQRLTKILFPPIPRPPPKYKYFLEKSDAFNFFYSATSAKPEEEITEVEYVENNPGRTE